MIMVSQRSQKMSNKRIMCKTKDNASRIKSRRELLNCILQTAPEIKKVLRNGGFDVSYNRDKGYVGIQALDWLWDIEKQSRRSR